MPIKNTALFYWPEGTEHFTLFIPPVFGAYFLC